MGWPRAKIRGNIEIREAYFPSLQGNPLRDPATRTVVVYLPPGYGSGRKSYPFIVALAGFLGTSLSFLNHDFFIPNLMEQADALITRGLPPFVLAVPDACTRYGGSQYLNSSATGRYEDFLIRDFIPWVEQTYRVLPRRGVMGKSSGGYGALRLCMRHPGLFRAAACHSGDLYFEWCYKPEFPKAAQALSRH